MKEFSPQFTQGISALTYWFEHGDDAREYTLPAVFLDENEVATTPPPQVFDYPDWWYVWVDLDKLVSKLLYKEKALVLYYFMSIYQNEKGAFYRWRQREDFKKLCYKFFLLLPKEYQGSVKINVNKILNSIHERAKKGEISLEEINSLQFYTPQEIAYILGCSDHTIYKLLRQGTIIGLKVGRVWRVKGQHLLDFINQPIRKETNDD